MKKRNFCDVNFLYLLKLILLTSLLYYPINSIAQFRAGVKAGVNITSLNYDNSLSQRPINKESKIGYLGGLTFQYFSGEKIGIQFETLYIQKGFKTEFDSLTNTQYERTINYLSIPFLTHVFLGNKTYSISLILGPYASYALNSTEIFTDEIESIKQNYSYDNDIDNRFEFGLQGGAGIKNEFSFGIIEIQGQYAYTFTSLFKWGAVNQDPERDRFFVIPEQAQNQGLQLSIHYYYPF